MNKEVLKSYLIRDKTFLRELYESPNKLVCNRILNFTSDIKLNTLIKYLHFLSNGEIPIKKANFDLIQSQKKLNLIKKVVEKKSAASKLLKAEREAKLKFLKQLSSVYAPLLYVLFNEN